MKCKKCGQEMNKNKICDNCGYKHKKKKLLKVALVIVALVAGVIGVIFIRGVILSKNAEDVVVTFLDGYIAKDSTIAQHLVGQVEDDIIAFDNSFSQAFAENFTYEIESSKCVGINDFVVNVKVSTIDFKKIFSDAYNEVSDNYSDEKFTDELDKKIKSSEFQKIDLSGELTVCKTEDEYKILMNFDLADILTGGMRTYLNSLQEGE